MKITQIRNATLHINYGGVRFLIDPMLAEQGAYPGLPGTVNSEVRNPTAPLPMPIAEILDVDVILLTHLHPDHWDAKAQEVVSKDQLLLVQNEQDRQTLSKQGFNNIQIIENGAEFRGITLTTTECQHGYDILFENPDMAARMGEVTGVIFSHPAEQTLYLVGDSIWTPAIEKTMKAAQPDVVIINAGWAHVLDFGPIIMGKEDILKTHLVLPHAKIVASHLEAVNHLLLTRAELQEYVQLNQIEAFVAIPADGETIVYE
ncbi:MBL fold metallo-hydrolase [Marinomonas ostreistagni]|uniref:MBL fold metallo-hydrolase n=1 Tax=Marinomonas ostreistagni TaxID=359209 RepID=A0ABS0ZBC4_9GAMM|nr:MBL fold metallo-hydrolase [Marinomonas ostreistagni]MBJ7550523.1 MBL fold metallo-hydrolase [Marinomonas ostreistagni]